MLVEGNSDMALGSAVTTASRMSFGQTVSAPPIWMGVLNVTPDSFSDGGRYVTVDAALRQAETLLADGAQVLDVGGESTRPGATPVPQAEEWQRVVPVIQALRQRFPPSQLSISVDTRRLEVAQAALDAGATWLNDVEGLQDAAGYGKAALTARYGAQLVIMHSCGIPADPTHTLPPEQPVWRAVVDRLQQQRQLALSAGMREDCIWLDPGFGFGKTALQNRELLASLSQVVALGSPVLMGVSRKRFLAAGTQPSRYPPERREAMAAVVHLVAWQQGVRCFRVHDVGLHRQAFSFAHQMACPGQPKEC